MQASAEKSLNIFAGNGKEGGFVAISHFLEKIPQAEQEKAAGLLPGYHINFVIFATVYGIALLFWLRIDATEPVAPAVE